MLAYFWDCTRGRFLLKLKWAKRMTWRGESPIVQLWDRVYHKGVRITKAAYRPITARRLRTADIGKWIAAAFSQRAS